MRGSISIARTMGFMLLIGFCSEASASILPGASPTLHPTARGLTPREIHRTDLLARASDEEAPSRQAAGDVLTEELPERADPARRTPPGIAFLMSAAVPGAGQLLQGRNRAFAYMGLEAIAWIAHFAWKDAGNKKEGEYEAYARQHWDLDRWNELASESSDTCRALPPGVSYADAKETIENFLEIGNYQHFYEDIGKLEAYRAGWDDFECSDPGVISPNRGEYRGMRSDSNDYLNNAKSAITVVFLNRVISAVDAYRTSRGARMPVADRTALELNVAGSLRHPRAVLQLRRTF